MSPVRGTIQVRRLGPGDETTAAEVIAAMSGACAGPEHVHDWLANPAQHLVAAFDGGTAVGWAYAYELPRLVRERPGALLYEIDVAATHRRRGVARAMIAELLRIVRARGADRMWVLTNASNEAAMRLYASAGATRTNPDDVMWEWELG